MALIPCAIAFGAGILLAFGAYQGGWLGCGIRAAGWWWLPLLGALLVGWWGRRAPEQPGPLRWPRHAGFTAPPSGPPPGLWPALAFCLVAGFWRMGADPMHACWTLNDLAAWNLPAAHAFDRTAPTVTLEGYVHAFPTVRDERQQIVLTVQRLMTDGGATHAVRGRVRFTAPLTPRLRLGDPVQVRGRLVTPPEFPDFNYRDYLARQDIHSLLQAAEVRLLPGPRAGPRWRHVLADLRSRGLVVLARTLPEPHAALASGILLGVNAGIPDALQTAFNATSAGHVLVISGSNVALIAGLLLAGARRLVGRYAAWPVLAGIVLYALLVGGDAPVWRAAIMGCLVVVAGVAARRSTALVSLAAALWLMALLNPHVLWDVGFQLSAAATAGLVFYVQPLRRAIQQAWPNLPPGLLAPAPGSSPAVSLGGIAVEAGIMTVAATLLTLPLIAWHFGRVSVVGLFVSKRQK